MASVASSSRRRFLVGASSLGALALAGRPRDLFANDPRPAVAHSLSVDPEPAQVMHGFGAAGAWWPNDLVHFRPVVQDQVADLLFGPDGIALSVYRYNIGGGGTGVLHPVRAPESFLVAPGVYDWSKDPGGRLFLRAAAERGVPTLIGFVNSAPAVWTTTGGSCGGLLTPEAEDAFATYLVDVVAHFRDAEGIHFAYVSPMNEPDYRFEGCGQEGMSVPVEQRAALVQAVGRQLAARAPGTRVTADESSRTGEHFMREASRWLSVPGTAEYVAALAVHRYDYPNDLILELASGLADQFGKPLWSTELCCFDSRTGAFGPQFDPTIRSGLMLANLMWQGITVANDSAFHWWVACSSEIGADPAREPGAASQPNDTGWNDGLLYYDPNYAENGNQAIYPTKRFYVLGNFSRYVRPGARRYPVTGAPRQLRVLAFASDWPDAANEGAPVQLPPSAGGPTREWSVVVINNAPADSDPTAFSLQLPVAGWFVVEGAIETSAEHDLEPVSLPSISRSGQLAASVPAQSVTTYVVRAVA